MTYEDLYKPAINAYLQKWNTFFDSFLLRDIRGLSIIELQCELEDRQNKLQQLQQNKPPIFDFDLSFALGERFAEPIAAYEQEVSKIFEETQRRKDHAVQVHEVAVKEAEAVAENSVSPLTKKYEALLSYKEKVREAFARYGIKPSDISIEEAALTRADLEALLDEALHACKSIGDDRIRQKLSVIYEPGEDATQDDRIYHAVAVIFLMIVLAPVALVTLFSYMFWRVSGVYRNIEGLKIADKLMYGIDFSKYKDAPNYADIPDVDFSAIEEDERKQLEALAVGDPRKVKDEIQREINKYHSKIAEDYRSATNSVMNRYTELVDLYAKGIATIQGIVDDYKANLKAFGTTCSTSPVMDTQFVLGQQKGTLDVKYDIGLQNIVFADKSPEMVQFVRLLFSNMLLSVKPKQLSCVIYDPESLGADFATFMSQETADFITVETRDFQKTLDSLRSYSQTNLRILDQKDINTYNREADEKGMVTLEYKLLIIVSGIEKPLENRILTEFMKISARTGVFVWLLNSPQVPGCHFYPAAFSGVADPYPITPTLFMTVASTYLEAFRNGKDEGILYKTAFADKYLPKDSWWKENTDKGIKLNLGLEGGDPSKGYALELGDANVHALCAGATGAGKSAFLNQLLLSLITRYSPSTLELVMVDFKNVEFASLTDLQTHISRVPHARILAGTKDGEYAISIFDYVIEEMTRRNNIFAAAGTKKLETYNQKMRQMGTPEKCIPRLLIIIDEFQVMFTEVDPKSVDVIQSRIRSLAKLARSSGCHMLFCSQSMKGTMPKDIMDQFSLRLCLRCSSDTSNDILGAPVAAKIKQKFGYIYSNTNAGETQDSTRLWRTPFASEEVISDTLDEVNAFLLEKHEQGHNAYFYDEKEKYTDELLQNWYTEHAALVEQEKRVFVLGERTEFSLNNAPVNFLMRRADGENIFFYAFEESDFTNLCMTFITNIRLTPNATLLINCADADLFTILDLESWYSKDLLDIAKPMTDVSEWISTLQDIIERRQESDPSEYGPLYFMALRWDKQQGICRNENYALSDKWKAVIMNGPAVDVHIIFGAQLFKDVPAGTLSLYNHMVCARGPEDASFKFLSNAKMAKLPDDLGFALYHYGTAERKFKIYQHTFTRKAEEREIKL